MLGIPGLGFGRGDGWLGAGLLGALKCQHARGERGEQGDMVWAASSSPPLASSFSTIRV